MIYDWTETRYHCDVGKTCCDNMIALWDSHAQRRHRGQNSHDPLQHHTGIVESGHELARVKATVELADILTSDESDDDDDSQ